MLCESITKKWHDAISILDKAMPCLYGKLNVETTHYTKIGIGNIRANLSRFRKIVQVFVKQSKTP